MNVTPAIAARASLAAQGAAKAAAQARAKAPAPAAVSQHAASATLPPARDIADNLLAALLQAQSAAHAGLDKLLEELRAHGHKPPITPPPVVTPPGPKDPPPPGSGDHGHGHGDEDHGPPPVVVPPPSDPPPQDPPPQDPPPVVDPPPVTTPPQPQPQPPFAPTAAQIATPRIVEVVRQQLAERTTPVHRRASEREQAYLAAARSQHLATVKLAGMAAAMRGEAALSLLTSGQAQLLAIQTGGRSGGFYA